MSRTSKTPAERAVERRELAQRMLKRAEDKRDAAYRAYKDADAAKNEAEKRARHAAIDPDLPDLPSRLQAVQTGDTP